MTVLFGVDFPALILSSFDGQLEQGTLRVESSTTDEYGQTIPSFADEPVQGVLSQWKDEIRIARGYDAKAMKIMLLAQGITEPKLNDRVVMQGRTFRVTDCRFGAGLATYDVAGVQI